MDQELALSTGDGAYSSVTEPFGKLCILLGEHRKAYACANLHQIESTIDTLHTKQGTYIFIWRHWYPK